MDPSSIPWPLVGYGSAWGLVGFFVWLVFTGRLVPRSTLEDALQWRTESRIKDAQIAEKDRQLTHMAEVGRTVDAIMRSIHRNAQSGDRQSAEEAP